MLVYLESFVILKAQRIVFLLVYSGAQLWEGHNEAFVNMCGKDLGERIPCKHDISESVIEVALS